MGLMAELKEKRKKPEETEKKSGSLMAELKERSKYLSIDTNGVDDNYINTFISDANNFLGSAEEEYSKVGWGTASSAFDSRSNSWKDLSSRYDTIKAWLFKNRDKIGEESYNSINEALDSYHSGASSVVNAFKSATDFYSQFDTEDSYNAYKSQQEMAKSEQGVQGWNKYLEDEKASTEKVKAEQEDETFWEKIGRYLGGGTVDTTLPTAGVTQTINDLRDDDTYKKPTDAWTEDQKNIFGYLYMESPEKAYQYAIETNNSINSESEEEALKKIAESASSGFWAGVGNTAGAIATAPFGMADFFKDLADANAGRPITSDGIVSPFEYSQAVTEGISSHLNEIGGTLDENIPIIGGKGWGDVYGLGTSIVQSAVSGLTLGSAGTLISYFGQGAASGVDDALSRGASDWQAALYGISLGAFEGIAESIGVDRLFKIGSSTTFKELLKNTLRQAGAEGIEEGLTSILSNIADNVIMQDQSNFNAMVEMYMSQGMSEKEAKKKAWMDSVEGIAFDTIAGAVSGGVHGGVATSIQTGISNHKASKLYGNQSQTLVDEALGSQFGDTKAVGQKYQDKLSKGKNLSGWNLNELLEVTDKSKLKSTILQRLGELGETGDVTTIADVLIRQAMGEELSSKDTKILNNSKAGHVVLAEINEDNIKSGGLGNKWAENIGTRTINPQTYNKALNDAITMVKEYHKKAEEDAVNSEISEAQKSLPDKVKVSESGKTVYKDEEGNSHDVNVKRIVSTDNGEVKVELDNGKTVSTKSLSFSTNEEGLMYEMVARMEVSSETANELINSLKPTNASQAAQYFTGVPLAYKYGTINYEEGLKNIPLSDKVKKLAFNRGKIDATTNAKTNRGVAKGNATKKGGIIFEGDYVYDESTANELQKASMPYIEVIDQMSNLETHVFESKVIKGKRVAYIDGKWRKAPNGYFKDGNKIYIDINAGNAAEGAMLYTMSHEITHYIREWNAKGFKELGDFLISEYGKMGVSVTALIEAQKKKIEKRYKEEGKTLPGEAKLFDMAYEELVADAMSEMLTDPKAYEKLAKLKQKNRTLWEKVGEAIKAILDKFKSALGIYKTEKPSVAREAYLARGFSAETYNKLQDLYIKAFAEADDNYGASIGSRNLNELADAKNENGEPLFQYRAMEEDESAYREMLHKWGKMTGEQIDNLFATIDNAMELIKDNLEVLDYAWEADIDDRAFSPVKPNSDKLYQVSLDFSTLCRKRILQQTVQAQLQEALNKPLSREEGIAIRDALIALQEEGRQIEVACALCYVESARMKSPEQIKKFINNKEKVIKEFFANKSGGNIKEKIKQAEADARARLGVGDAPLKSLPGKVAQEIRDAKKLAKESYKPTAEEQKLIEAAKGMTVSDFTSPEGLENLAKKYPRLFDAYTSYIRNATKSKGIENDTWWRAGDSNRIGDVLIANMNKENGLRTQSWSDFQVIHILDYIASTIELATRNTKAQAYSKVPDYVELMGLTGVMINMSLIPTATFNGTLNYDSVEGIDYKRALELRDKYPKTAGTICIGVDNGQIKLLLADNTIDYVIPYHRSGMSKALRKLMHIPTWTDYELYQSESNLSRADAEKQVKKYGVKLLDASDPNYHKGTSFSEWFDIKEAQQVAKKENANPTDKAKQKKYGVMYGGYMAMQNAANNYLKLCAERGITPKFSHEKADFTAEENYWKLLIDRKMVDNVTGEVIEQETIKPIFNEGEIMRILNDELARYPKVKEDQDYAIRRVTEKMLSGEVKGGMSAEAIAKVVKKPVDNVTNVNIIASAEDMNLYSERDSSYEDYSKPITIEDIETLRSIGEKSINTFTSEDIEKAQKWAYKFYQELGIKSPFFRAWFGDWRAHDIGKVKIVSVPTIDISQASLTKGNYTVEDTGWQVYAGKVLNDDTRHHTGGNRVNVKSLNTIDAILNNAILLDTIVSQPDTNKKSANTAFLHKLYTVIKYDNQLYIAKTTIEEYYNETVKDISRRAYNLKAIKIEPAGGQLGINSSSSVPDASSVYSISDLYKYVKSYDKEFSAAPEVSKYMLNKDGTPKVFYHGTSKKFSVFDFERAGQNWDGDSRLGKGFYFAYTEHEALQWTEGTNVIKAYLNLQNPLNVDSPTPKNIAKEIDKYIANKIASFDEKDSWISKEQYIKNLERIKDMYMNDVGMFINEFKYDDNGKMTDGIREFLSSLGYDGIISKDEVVAFYPNQIKSATDNIGTFNKAEEDIHYSDRDSYAPTFYSHMGKVIDDIKLEKMGANGVVSYLKGRGVKDEEIKWSGIEAFLEGKKSVTKAELQEFVAGSQLQIEETNSGINNDAYTELDNLWRENFLSPLEDVFDPEDFDETTVSAQLAFLEENGMEMPSEDVQQRMIVLAHKIGKPTRWEQYKLDGGENYRELVFKMPNSTYSNRAMRGHWGQDAEGILVHARIQDFTADGKKMLFIEELQSDWHNEGLQKGYTTKEYEDAVEVYNKLAEDYANKRRAFNQYVRSSEFRSDPDDVSKKKFDWLRRKMDTAEKRMQDAERDIEALKKKGMGDVADAPFRSTYHEYVLKRLLRMAAEEGYDSIGWTPAEIQSDRWSDEYAEAYRIEYDQDMPKFLRKYGKKWGATVGKTVIEGNGEITYTTVNGDKYKSIREWFDDVSEQLHKVYGDKLKGKLFVKEEGKTLYVQNKVTGQKYARLIVGNGNAEVWSMDIPGTMTESVLYEGQVMYSERDTDAISDRTLLANALESVTTSEAEKTKLSQYKAKIALIESEQAKLTEINAKIKELSFATGKRDTEAINRLQFEKNQTANRINTYDKQLLNLESTTALKNVLEREKALLRKRLEQKGKQALKEQKQKDAETIRELLTRHTESRKKAIEGRHKTEMRHKIKNIVSDLNKLLLNPTKDQHVPIGLQKVVAEALDAINMDTMNAEERVAYYNDLISKSSNPDEIAMLKQKRDFFEYRDMSFKDKITALKNAYAEFKESDDPLIRNAHNEAVENLIKNTSDEVGNKSLKDMSLAQLEAVYDMYKAILATVRNSNKMFKEGRQATVTENSEAVKGEVKEVGGHNERVRKFTKGIKSFTWSLLKPIYALKRIGSKTLTALFDNVRAGEETYAVDINEAREFFADKSKKYNYSEWDFKKRFDFKDSAGNSFALSLEQIMSLYAYSKREQADGHLEVGGFVFDDSIEVTEKNKFGIPVKYEVNDATPYRLRVEDLAVVIGTLTADQKNFVDEMQTYLSEVMGAKGNEVSLAMYDIKMFKEKHYFPLKTSKYFREFNPEQTANPMLRNSGFTKKTVPHAGNPIVLSNFMEVWTTHINDMSMYHSFVLPLEDFMRVYNYSSTAGGYDSVQQYIKNAYGAEANQYIERLMQDINGGVVSNNLPNGWLKMFGKFKKATVAASLSTIVQQPTAIIRAMALINPRYFVGISLKEGHKKTWEEIKKYAPIAIIKEMGGIDVGSGRQAKDFITAQTYKGFGKVKGFFTDSSYRDSIFMWGATKADELGWNSIWKAVKREVASKQKLQPGTEEFFKACGARFTEVVTQTQVYDSVFARSGIMRDKGDLNKFATAFMGEPTTSFNMIYNAILSAKRGGSKAQAVRTISSVYASIVGAAALASLIYALRDDDEDEAYLEKWAEAFGNKLSSEIWIHNMIPYIRDIASIFEGWDVERPDMSIITDIKSSFDKLFKVNDDGEYEWNVDFSDFNSVYGAIENFGGSIASAFGLPLKNLMRDTRGIFNGFKAMSDDVESGDFGGAFIEGFTGDERDKSDKLYTAIINGDDGRLEIYKKGYKTEEAFETAVRTALRENDSRIHEAAQARYDGDISEYTRIAREIIAEGNFSQDTVVGAINSEISDIKKGEPVEEKPEEDKDEATSIYSTSDLNSAFDNGDTSMALEIIDDLVKTKVANGKTEKEAKSSLRSSMTSYWKPLYKEAYQAGDNSEMARIRQILYSSGLYGNGNEVVKTVQSWLNN